MKTVAEAQIGDTFHSDKVQKSEVEPFPGYEQPQPMVFSGIYPETPDDYDDLLKALS